MTHKLRSVALLSPVDTFCDSRTLELMPTQLETYLASLQRFGIQPGLERIRAALSSLGDPHLTYPAILVGGTNGKGSTCQFLAEILRQQGYRTGLYTSPHLYRWNERIRVLDPGATGHELFPGTIGDDELDTILYEALPYLEKVATEHGQPTEFETLTLLGLWHFARAQVDVAVIEVGLGGRWDATNVLEPQVSVITHVALDHCDRLGDTVEEIAADKVEISRPGRVLVTAETKPGVLEVFQRHCLELGCRLWPFRSPEWSNDRVAMESTLDRVRNLYSPHPALTSSGDPLPNWGEGGRAKQRAARPGEGYGWQHQLQDFQQLNLFTAAVANQAWLADRKEAVERSFDLQRLTARLVVPGRLELLRQRPDVIVDGANNPDGAAFLATQLSELRKPGQHLILVLGILDDKDYRAMVELLAPLADTVIATQSSSPRAAAADAIAEVASRFCGNVETVMPVQAAVERAWQVAQPEDLIVVTGSFYTIAEVDRDAVQAWSVS